jgi:hypothetical protein
MLFIVMMSSSKREPVSAARLRPHGRLEPPARGDVLVSVSVGPSGEAVAVWAGAGRPALPARVTVHGGGAVVVVPIADLGMASCTAQPLPDGRVLVVAGHGATVILNRDGEPLRQGNIGGGVDCVLTTHAGRIWVSYIDEAVYGDDPVTRHGIVRFTDELYPDWMYPDDGRFPVDDYEALNVDGETVWSCYYNGYSIARFTDQHMTYWRNPQQFWATALMVGADLCALVGASHPSGPRRVLVGRLAEDQYEPTREWLLTLPDGKPLPLGTPHTGRGADLHVFLDAGWYRLGLDDLS